MAQVLIFGDSTLDIQGLEAVLKERGYDSVLLSRPWDELESASTQDTMLIFLDVPYLRRVEADIDTLIDRCRASTRARLLALLSPDSPRDFDVVPRVDDFITYPYNKHEVLARVRSVLGSSPIQDKGLGPERGETLTRGPLVIDQDSYQVWVGSKKIGLTYKEYELLRFLAASPGKVFARDVLLDRVWGYNYFGGTRTVDMHIRRLRSKIGAEGQSFIETVRGVGYRFTAETQ